MVFFRATRSDAKRGVRKGKALAARRFKSARRHSQERSAPVQAFAAAAAFRVSRRRSRLPAIFTCII
jgi:hypothetical protein